eukprot:g110.t1
MDNAVIGGGRQGSKSTSSGDESAVLLLADGDAGSWTAQEVVAQLGSLKLSKDYAHTFAANDLCGADCVTLGQLACGDGASKAIVMDRMEKMKITSVGDQCKLLRFFVTLANELPRANSRRKADTVTESAKMALRSATSIINPLRSKREDGFQRARLNADHPSEFSFDNPAMDDGPASGSPVSSSSSKGQSVLRWFVHFKVMGIVLGFAFFFECCMYLYRARVSDIFFALALFPHVLGNPVICLGMFVILTAHAPAADKVSMKTCKRLVYFFVPCCCLVMFGTTTGGIFERNPVVKINGLIKVTGFLWDVVFWAGVPTALMYANRRSFRWDMGAYSLTFLSFGVMISHFTMSTLFYYLEVIKLDALVFGFLHVVTILVVTFRTAAWDTLMSFQQGVNIRGSAGYIPWLCAAMLNVLFEMFGRSPEQTMVVLIVWSLFLVVVYLQARLCAKRCAPYKAIPILILPLQLVGDLFTEMVFIEFSLTDWSFWFIMLFDVFLLIMRDAGACLMIVDACLMIIDACLMIVDGYKSGRIGRLLLGMAELLAGPDMVSIGRHGDGAPLNSKTPRDHWDMEPTEKELATVKRELTENCIVSEMLASLILCALLVADFVMDALLKDRLPPVSEAFPDDNSTVSYSLIAPRLEPRQRLEALGVYVVIMCMQIIGICISHQIIRHRNAIAAKLRQMKLAASLVAGDASANAPPPLAAGQSWHFFLSHCQSTAGDQVYSLCLELEAKSFSVWYDQRAEDLTSQGMQDGVAGSAIFILFLSEGVMSRPFVHLEVREALSLKKRVILMHEQDPRFNSVDFQAERRAAPDDLK